ncbi:MAG TPA: cytochrome b/b6 domain-containing protein [Caulobacteraceae bacterium]
MTAGIRTPSDRRYSTAAMLLHWTIAALILVQIGLGYYMNEILPDHSAAQDRIQTLHVSIGLTTLLLILVRIGVRLIFPPPPLPVELAGWEKLLAGSTHLLFYALMLALPLTGWAIVSLQHGPIGFWGLHFPRLPGLGSLAGPAHKPFRHTLTFAHTHILVYIVLANLFLHVSGALKHQFDGHPVLWRMVPFFRAPRA